MRASSPSASAAPGNQLGHESTEEECFVREIAAHDVGAAGVSPSLRERGVDRVEDDVESTRELVAIRDAKRDACLPDLALRPREPLTHGSRRHEEGRRDPLRIEAERDLEHQGRPDADFNRGMRAREHQRQAMVRNRGGERLGGIELLEEKLQVGRRALGAPPSPHAVDDLAASCGQEPRFGVRRAASTRPVCEGRGERFGQRILGGVDVSGLRREQSDQLPVAAPRDRFGRALRWGVALPSHRSGGGCHKGRTSTTP